jgi:hypothetical protein
MTTSKIKTYNVLLMHQHGTIFYSWIVYWLHPFLPTGTVMMNSCLPWMHKYSENIESLTRVCNACNSKNIETKRKWSLEYKINVRETEESIKNGQSRETGNLGWPRRRQTKQKTQHNMCWTAPHTRHNTKTSKSKHTTQYVLDTTMRKQAQIT